MEQINGVQYNAIRTILEKNNINDYIIRPNGHVDVNDDVTILYSDLVISQIQFGIINGWMSILSSDREIFNLSRYAIGQDLIIDEANTGFKIPIDVRGEIYFDNIIEVREKKINKLIK